MLEEEPFFEADDEEEDFVSLLVLLLVSLSVSDFAALSRSPASESRSDPVFDLRLPRLSVLYQPAPLNTRVGEVSTRWDGLSQRSQGCWAGAPKGSRFS